MVEGLLQDVRHALRSIGRSPGFSLVVIVTMALAIGANTALFSLLNAIVLRPLPVRAAGELMSIGVFDTGGAQRFIYQSTYDGFLQAQRSFSAMAMYSGGGVLRAEMSGCAVDGGIEGTSPNYFELLGLAPYFGRFFSTEEAAVPDGAPVVVISNRLWRRCFGDANALGATIDIEGAPLTVIGITHPSFFGLQSDGGSDFFVPMPTVRRLSGDKAKPVRALSLIGRLRAGVTALQARAEIEALWPAIQSTTIPGTLTAAEQADLRGWRVRADPAAGGFSALRQRYATPALVLVGLTAILLAIGCVNISGLMLARAVLKEHQYTIRRSLGASRWQLARLPLIESVLLVFAGSALSLPMAWSTSRAVVAAMRQASLLPLTRPVTPDVRVFVVMGLVALTTGALSGFLPAWFAASARRAAPSAGGATRSLGRAGRGLVVVQIAFSLVLLTGAGLFAQSLRALHGNDLILRPDGQIVWTRLWLQIPARNVPSFDRAYYRELLERFARIPGVHEAALSQMFPSALPLILHPDTIESADTASDAKTVGVSDVLSPGFFRLVNIPVMRGRDFTWDDDLGTAPVAIVNNALARSLFSTDDVVGRRVRDARDPRRRAFEIVGVVADAPMASIREPHLPALFRPMLQEPSRGRVPIALVRADHDSAAVRAAYTRVAGSLGRHYVRGLSTLDTWVDYAVLQERLLAGFASWFAMIAVALACIGIYGLLGYAVARRTREIGVRLALGATSHSVLRSVVGEGVALALAGVVIGVPLAVAAARLTRSLLYGIAPGDRTTLIGSAIIFVIVALVSAWLPARRAASIEPIQALRHE